MEHISDQPLDLVGLLAQAHHPQAGAVVLFSGDVRDSNLDQSVSYLEYEAHGPMANKMIEQILQEARLKWHLNIAVAQHRTGRVGVGESAVVVITASKHRREAYAANRFIIDKIKHEAPIWKCEFFTDGTKQWGGNCNCHQTTGSAHQHVYEFEPEKQSSPRTMELVYHSDRKPATAAIIRLYESSGINRPTADPARIEQMYAASNLVITAWHGAELVGIARSLTDFCYACYLSDLAVDQNYQHQGIGKELIRRTKERIGNQTMLLLLAAPAAMEYYGKVGFEKVDNGFIIKRTH